MKQSKLHRSVSNHVRGLFLSLLFMLAVTPVWADETGKIGENVTYTLTDDGTLTISGTGDMTNWEWKRSPFFITRLSKHL